MNSMMRRRNAFTLMEVTVASVLTVSLAVMLGTTWRQLSGPMLELIAWGQLFQEIDLAVAALGRDLGGSQPDYKDPNTSYMDPGATAPPLGGKQQGRLLGVRQSPSDPNVLQLWFDGGGNPSIPPPTWPTFDSSNHSGDALVEYSYSADDTNKKYLLVRRCTVYGSTASPSQYTVASLGKPPAGLSGSLLPALIITPQQVNTQQGNNVSVLQLDLTFTYHYPQEAYNPNCQPVTRTCTLVVPQFP
jgi:hypothetical protein